MTTMQLMALTAPTRPERGHVTGVATFNAKLPSIGKGDEGKEKRPKAMNVKVSFLIRPNLPSCSTAVMTIPSNARTSDVLGAAWAEFERLRERHGTLWGALPSEEVDDYALHLLNYWVPDSRDPGRVGDECPPTAVFARMYQSHSSEMKAAKEAADAAAKLRAEDNSTKPSTALGRITQVEQEEIET